MYFHFFFVLIKFAQRNKSKTNPQSKLKSVWVGKLNVDLMILKNVCCVHITLTESLRLMKFLSLGHQMQKRKWCGKKICTVISEFGYISYLIMDKLSLKITLSNKWENVWFDEFRCVWSFLNRCPNRIGPNQKRKKKGRNNENINHMCELKFRFSSTIDMWAE